MTGLRLRIADCGFQIGKRERLNSKHDFLPWRLISRLALCLGATGLGASRDRCPLGIAKQKTLKWGRNAPGRMSLSPFAQPKPGTGQLRCPVAPSEKEYKRLRARRLSGVGASNCVWLFALLFLTSCFFAPHAGWAKEAEPPALERGETLLDAAGADKVLAQLAAQFKAHPVVKARLAVEMDDLVGKRTEEGELWLARPDRLLRKFTKPTPKAQLLDGPLIQEYLPALKKFYVKDFSKAPQTLKLVRAAFTMDVKTLNELFKIYVCEARPPQGVSYRLVFIKRPDLKLALPYARIQARIGSQDVFFREIEYTPTAGDKTLERYLDVQELPQAPADVFKLDIPAGIERQVDVISDN
jgi:outer membrane lipoprotein-sorting protein